MAKNTVKIGGRVFALAFTLDAMANMMDIIPEFDLGKINVFSRSPKYLPDMVRCLAQQGELLEGRKLNVDRAWFGAHMSPSPVGAAKVQVAVLNAIADGLKMETEEDEERGEIDVTLEEIKKNDSPDA